jgi:hypothetical protein
VVSAKEQTLYQDSDPFYHNSQNDLAIKNKAFLALASRVVNLQRDPRVFMSIGLLSVLSVHLLVCL